MAIAPTRILKVVDANEAVTPTPAEPVRLVNKDGSTFGGGSVSAASNAPPADGDGALR
ncbi:Hypothetical protein NRBB56_0332 [Bifidobacterium breve]|nr:hypothetical protein [Bifidobacterium breve]AUD84390.1 Hypothetical protein NRBB56_0332 [Bifidobacterium breve]